MKFLERPFLIASRTAPALAVALALVAALGTGRTVARADVVSTVDGRIIEGKIFEETGSVVRVDAMLAGVRAKVGIKRSEIASMEKKDLPADFFDPTPEVAPRASDPSKFPAGTNLYLEVPIVGSFGAQVVPSGVQSALSYAVLHKIPNVVFTVDSQGGDRLAARDVYKILAKYADKLRYIALVRDSVGVCMVVPVWCKDVYVLPGANLGGVVLEVAADTPTETAAQLSQVAVDLGQDAEKRGWPAALIRAMVDPSEKVVAWRGEDGKVVTAPRPPETLPANSAIVKDSTDEVLTLSREEAVALGLVRAFDGAVSDLGPELGLSLWTAESDRGAETMVEAARKEAEKQKRIASRKDAEAARLIKRRETLASYLDRNLAMAHAWDPEQNAKSTYQQTSSSWEQYWGGAALPQTISRSKWRELTDYTVAALVAAHKGATELEKLEARAKEFGLEPLYQEGELAKMKEDLEIKIRMLQFWRERKTSS